MNFLFVALLLSFGVCNAQTCILGKIVKGKIFIAADSRIIKTKGTSEEIGTMCKIVHGQKYYVAISGNFMPEGIYDSVKQWCNTSKSYKEIKSKIFFELNGMMQHQIFNTFYFTYKEIHDLLVIEPIQILLAYFEKGKPKLYKVTLPMFDPMGVPGINDPKPIIAQTLLPPNVEDSDRVELGIYDDISDKFNSEDTWKNVSISSKMEELIKIESEHSPYVDTNVSILEISKRKYKWVNPECVCNR